ncbi:hypothetical protein OZN62_05035 [Aurantiacibacter sp. MUD11]|uniref:hypothetical protein n=1 Tax=Aurantiacibacter sp. MUD11 TaxID=3003265 RepID=UPI0022AA6A8E|nr:hypothetical protein [Aurantiacibacter sp. MUD11]WAT18939.1 hypothetical protein OZN62_05035 [Aurantiacibacter sp. MUD11]
MIFRKSLAAQLRAIDAQDLLLLQVALGEPDRSERAWSRWCAEADFDALAAGCLLIPLCYHLQARRDGHDGVIQRMRGAHSKNWIITQMLEAESRPLMAALASSSVPWALGDDLALANHFYPHRATRPIYEIALYTASEGVEPLSQLVAGCGLASAGKLRCRIGEQAIVRVRHLPAAPWDQVLPATEENPVPILSPTQQFWTSFTANRPQLLLRLLDLGILLQRHYDSLDVTAIQERAKSVGLAAELAETLQYLHTVVGLDNARRAASGAFSSGQAAGNGKIMNLVRTFAFRGR